MLQTSLVSPSTIRLNRRSFLAAASSLMAASVLPRAALALAGPFTFKQGAYDVAVLDDGYFDMPLAVINAEAKPEELQKLLGLAADAKTNKAVFSPVLLSSGNEKILLDTGTGGNMGATAGTLLESLKSAGVAPDAITKVVYTHLHPDHFWGTVGKDGTHVFANASYHIAENELNFWTAADLASKMPDDMKQMVTNTQTQASAIKDKIMTFKTGVELLPGVAVMDTAGHTPGHVSFELAGGDGLIITGDALTVPAVFFAHPEWKFGFDADGELAGKNRRKMLDMAASTKKPMLGYHWPYPGLGRAEAKDGAFVYVPA
jgi:glyoxylase-like metal-dependent hydrolase (beta-lactamase superfamily II)